MGRLHGPVVGGVVQIDQRVKFTKEVQSGLFHPWGDAWYVDGDNGNADYSGRGASDSKVKLSQAIAAATDNDFIYLKAADYEESAPLVLSLNDVQIVGVTPNQMQPHLDIEMAGETTFNPMMTVSGRGNSFYNLCFRHGSRLSSGVGYATDLCAALISGRYNYFENVYFYTPLYAQQDVANTHIQAGDGYVGVQITGHNNYFKGCKFGTDGLDRDVLNFNLYLNGGIGNIFEDCIFQMTATGTTPLFVGVSSYTRDMRATLFRRCTFYAHSANYTVTLADAFGWHGGGNTAGIILEDCNFVNVENVSDTDSDVFIWKQNIKGEFGADTVKIAGIALRNQGA